MLFLRRSLALCRMSEAASHARPNISNHSNIIYQYFFVWGLTLFPHLFVLLPGDEPSPAFLDDPGKGVKLPLPHFLQQEELQTEIPVYRHQLSLSLNLLITYTGKDPGLEWNLDSRCVSASQSQKDVLLPIQGSSQRLWCVPSGTGHYPCWQSGGGEGLPAAQVPSSMATSQLSEWRTWVTITQTNITTAMKTLLHFRIRITSSETCWRPCGRRIPPVLRGCSHADPDIRPDAWPWNGSVCVRVSVSYSSFCFVTARMLTCSPPSLLASWSR